MEKHAYALVKELKSFKVYILHSKIIDYVPNISMKDILMKPDSEGKRGKWIAKILEKDNAEHILTELHDGPTGDHFNGETTTHKVLRVGYYWTTLFRDAHAHVRKFQICQVNADRERRPAFPLHPVTIENPFKQWGLDVDGEVNPNSSKLPKYIVSATDYFYKWTEGILLKVINDNEIRQFVQRNIITKFGVPSCFGF